MSRSLERLQAEFSAALIEPAAASALSDTLLANSVNTFEPLALYRGNIAVTGQQALAVAYPVVRALLGAEFFDELVIAYGRQHPSVSGDLNCFGATLAEFVADFAGAKTLPYLRDVAALEWAVHLAHHAADAEPLPRQHIAALRPDQLLAARFELNPSVSWKASPFPIASIWLAHQPRSTIELPESTAQPESALIVRPGWQVQVIAASAAELTALDAIRNGAAMQAAMVAALRVDPQFDFAAAIVRWLDLAVFTAEVA
jgi:hypothetical protein